MRRSLQTQQVICNSAQEISRTDTPQIKVFGSRLVELLVVT